MTWLKLDDGFDGHPKVAPLGPLSFALHVKALLYAARNGTDGFVPAAKVRTLLDVSGVYTAAGDPDGRGDLLGGGKSSRRSPGDVGELVQVLVDAGLWEADRERGGFALHDFLDYNPPAAKVEEERAAARERMRELRARRRSGEDSPERSPERSAEQAEHGGGSSPTPGPVPVPE